MTANEVLAIVSEFVTDDTKEARLALADMLAEVGQEKASISLREGVPYYLTMDDDVLIEMQEDLPPGWSDADAENLINEYRFNTEGERKAFVSGVAVYRGDVAPMGSPNEEEVLAHIRSVVSE